MRSIRGPEHHLEVGEKEWIEKRLLWLRDQFGLDPLRRPPLEPTSSILPDQWDASDEAGADLLDKLCGFMRVDPARLQLHYYSESESHDLESAFAGETNRSGPAGLFFHPEDKSKLVIGLEDSGLARPAALTATICHELGHVHLLADQRINRDEEDSEPLTDLLTVYFGAGIFNANTAFQFNQWTDNTHQGWSTRRMGYLPEHMWGYALASYAWMRGEKNPSWARHLRENIHYYYDDASHYLATTRETTLPFSVV